MKTYEALVIFPIQATGEPQPDGKNIFEEAVKKNEGKIVNCTELGRRFLGYSVRKSKEGYLVNFLVELLPGEMDAFKRSLQITEGILKFTIVKPPKPDSPRHARKVLGPVA